MRADGPDLEPFEGPGFCHVPSGVELDVAKLAESDSDDDRWNEQGQPTIYLALDLPVALAEYARHASGDEARDLLRFDIRLDRVADLRQPETRAQVGHQGSTADLADRGLARRLAARLRARPDCQGLVVPSLAFPEDPMRGNLVVFADRLPAGIAEWLGEPLVVGRV